MQPLPPASEAVAGDEFHRGVGFVLHGVSAHFQAKPLAAVIIQVESFGAGGGVPGGEQVIGAALGVGSVAGAHQGERIGGLGLAVVQGLAAGGVGLAAAARAAGFQRIF